MIIFPGFISFLENFFLYPIGIYALLSLVPLIIIYLIKPKPKKKKIPSLMFLMKETGHEKRKSFFQRMSRDVLLIIHIIILVLIVAAMSRPYILAYESSMAQNTILVIDASASMNANYNTQTRFEKAKDIALSLLSDKNTIILAKNIADLVVEDVSRFEALRTIGTLRCSETETNLYDAVMLAGDIAIGKENSRVVVISDFNEVLSSNKITTAKMIIESKGVPVLFKPVSNEVENVGIIDMEFQEGKIKVWIKNYNKEKKKISVDVGMLKKEMEIDPNSIEVVEFENPGEDVRFRVLPKDDFNIDNVVFITVPKKMKTRVLFVSNNLNKFLYTALGLLPGFILDEVKPPQSTSVIHDIVVYNEFNKDVTLPSLFTQPLKKAENGGAIIVLPQDDLGKTPISGYLPIKITGIGGTTKLIKNVENEITKDIDFGSVKRYLKGTPTPNSIVLVEAEDGSPIIGMKKFVDGYIFYYGIYDNSSDFKVNMYYPIFWKRVTDYLLEIKEEKDLNLKTGKVLNLGQEETVKTPTGDIKTSLLVLDDIGYYQTSTMVYSANLLSDKESNLEKTDILEEEENTEALREYKKEVPKEVTNLVLWIVLILVLFELIYVKIRGDF